MLTFTVTGIPKGQPRPKAARRGTFTTVYDPGTADEWKLLIRDAANNAWKCLGRQVFFQPVAVVLSFSMPRPKGHFRSNGELKSNSPRFCSSKPDADNLAKAVLDALTNLGIWQDDSQVVLLSVEKLYANSPSGVGMWCKIENAPQIPFPKIVEKA